MGRRITLRNDEDCRHIGVLDIDERRLVEESWLAEVDPQNPIADHYLVLDGILVTLLLFDQRINLLVGDRLYDDLQKVTCEYRNYRLPPESLSYAHLRTWWKNKTSSTGGGMESKLRIFVDGALAHELYYRPIDYGIPAFMDFTMTDPEDFDFLLFLRNMISNPERQKLMAERPTRSQTPPT